MKHPPATHHERRPGRRRASAGRGLSLVETVLASVIIAVALTAALRTVAAVKLMSLRSADRNQGHLLAHNLLSEILAQPYQDPQDPSVFGPEGDEVGPSRLRFDDVDDYHGWSESPPRTRAGEALAGFDNFTRQVSVAWVALADLNTPVGVETGIKRVVVVVQRSGTEVAQAVGCRTAAADRVLPDPGGVTDNAIPTAAAAASDTRVIRNQSINFSAAAAFDPDGDALSYHWNFGNGQTATGVNVSHAYAGTGTFAVTLTVSDGRGGVDTDQLVIRVRAF